MAIKAFTCWHGQLDGRMDEEDIRAYSAGAAAEKFAIAHEEGEDYDIVFVLVEDEVQEFKCTFNREVTCDYRQTATHDVPTDDEEV